jgi:hypothetical protein
MTKINYEFIQKIFNKEIKLKKKEDKIKLSNYSEYIPMYDIYSDNIYPIKNINLHYRLIDCHYRFITSEVKQWIKNKLEDATDKEKIELYKNNLEILDNYNIDLLEETSQKTLYTFSPDLGLSISICKRSSFNPYSRHLTPYYNRDELLKLGINNKLIDELTPEDLIDKQLHYKICKYISKNDISNEIIYKHMEHIIKNKCISWICYYSMNGSFIFNDYLRKNKKLPEYLYDGYHKLFNTILKIDSFKNNYYFYRFVWNDSFLKSLKIGDIFTDKGFLSATRDPFYSPALNLDFGLVLLKINVPKNIKGIGLFIENFSLFPKEEEFLILPDTKLKLVAKNDNFIYKHTNTLFEKNINKKYEFDLVNIQPKSINKIELDTNIDIPIIDFENISLYGRDRIDLFYSFLENCNTSQMFKYKNYIFQCNIFDSTTSYNKLYYNKVKEGLSIVHYKNGYPLLFIECGKELVVNFQQTITLYDDIYELDLDIDNLIAMIGKLFAYQKALIFTQYHNFSKFKDNYKETDTYYLYTFLYCDFIYNYFKTNKKFNKQYYNQEFKYWKLDEIGKSKLPDDVYKKFKSIIKENNWKSLFIEIVENHFNLYSKYEKYINFHYENIFKKLYFQFDIISYLRDNNYNVIDIPIFEDIKENRRRQLTILFNRNIRRIE